MEILSHPLYLAPIPLYTKLYTAKGIIIDGESPFIKQTFRSRAVIATENGTQNLNIPIIHDGGRTAMRDVRISEHGNWRHQHWNALEAAYRHTPFFQYYEDDFRPFYEKEIPFLYDFNLQLTELVCSLIGMEATLKPTEAYRSAPDGMADYRSLITPKLSWEADEEFRPAPYYQVFKEKHGFIPNLSIIDLLFNMGPESIIVLNDSQSQPR